MKVVRKLMLSLIALISCFACLTVSTYAWFQVNSEAKVGGFEFQATGGLGFLISVDGVNYSTNLTSEQMKLAIIAGYNDNYELKNNKLYYKNSDNYLAENEITDIMTKEILLSPVTSKDGVNFSSLTGGTIINTDGKFMEFSLYFKAASANAHDNLSYDIYLCGENLEPTPGNTVPRTHILTNNPDEISVKEKMVLYDGTDAGKVLSPDNGDKIVVHTSNATRLSIKEDLKEQATIYEITNEFDLGSYATNYSSKTDLVSDELTKKENDKLYNSAYNAMYTYYNNLRPYSNLKPMNYEEKPTTVRNLTDEHIITNVKSGEEAKKVTFRFWLEGWDADCFDGLTKSINVRLLFNSKVGQ